MFWSYLFQITIILINQFLSHVFLFVLLSFSAVAQKAQLEMEIDSVLNQEYENDSIRTASYMRFVAERRYSQPSKKLINEAFAIANRIDNDALLAICYMHYGNYFIFNSQLDSAEFFLEEGMKIPILKKRPFVEISFFTAKGGINNRKGAYDKAIEYYLSASDILDRYDEKELEKDSPKYRRFHGQSGSIRNALANLYQDIGEYDLALTNYELSANHFKQFGGVYEAGVILANKGALLLKMNKLDEALEAQLNGRALKVESGLSSKSVATSDLNIGMIYAAQEKYDEALKKFDEAAVVFEEGGYLFEQCYVYTEKGLVYLAREDWERAKDFCLKGKVIAEKQQEVDYYAKSCDCLYKVYKKLDQPKEALAYFEIVNEINDSIFNEKQVRNITRLEMQYEFEKEQALQAEADRERKRINSIITASLIALLSLISIIAIVTYRNFKNKQKAETLLSAQNVTISKTLNEKETLLKEIHHRVKNNLQVISSLLNIQSRHIEDPKAIEAIQEGRNRVKSMALIHQNLYQDDDLVGVNSKDYIEKLIRSLVTNYKIDQSKLNVVTEIDDVSLDVDVMIPIGLVLNELISNALKYAFVETQEGEILVKFKESKDLIFLLVSDSGIGLPSDFNVAESKSLGFKLIKSFSNKLKADLKISGEGGTTVALTIPKT